MNIGRWLIAAAVFAILFSRVPAADVLSFIRLVNPAWAAAGLLLTLGAQTLAARRLKLLTDARGLGFSVTQLLQINLATLFYGLCLPGGSMPALAIRFYRISAPQQEYAAAGVAILLDRVAATTALCIVGLVAWLVADPVGGEAAASAMAVALLSLVVVQGALRGEAPGRFAGLIVRRLPAGLRPADVARLLRALPLRTEMTVMAYSLAAHVLGIFAYWCVAQSVDLGVTIGTIAWVRSAVVLAALLPVTVAGVGVRETAFLLLLAPYGIAAGQAVAFSLAVFGLTIVAVGAVGGAWDGWSALRRRGRSARARD